MPIEDHGGFDLVAEISEATALAAARAIPFGGADALAFTLTNASGASTVSGTITTVTTVKAVSFVMPNRLVIVIDIAETHIDILKQFVFPLLSDDVAAWVPPIKPTGSITVNATLELTPAHALAVNLVPGGAGSAVTTSLDEAPILASPVVTMLLAQAILADPAKGEFYQQSKNLLMATFTSTFQTQVAQTLTQLGTVILAAAPIFPATPSGTPLLVTRSAFQIRSQSLKLCYQLNGSGGMTTAITLSNMVRRTAGGAPIDAMVIVLSNAFVLRDLIRDALSFAFGIPLTAFSTAHPLMLFGPVPITIPAGAVPPGIASFSCNSIFGGIDGTNIRLQISITAKSPDGAFAVTVSFDIAFSVLPGAGSPPSLAVAPVGGSVVSSDLSIAWWVYAGVLLTGAVPILHIIATADAIAGAFLNGPLAIALDALAAPLGVVFSAPITSGLPPLTVRAPVSLSQANARTRIPLVTIPGMPFPVPFADPFMDNDIVVTLV